MRGVRASAKNGDVLSFCNFAFSFFFIPPTHFLSSGTINAQYFAHNRRQCGNLKRKTDAYRIPEKRKPRDENSSSGGNTFVRFIGQCKIVSFAFRCGARHRPSVALYSFRTFSSHFLSSCVCARLRSLARALNIIYASRSKCAVKSAWAIPKAVELSG